MALLLVVSVAANLALLLQARRSYARQLAEQIWPTGTPLNAEVRAFGGGKRSVLLLGDSRIAEWGFPELPDCRVINAGVSGISTAQLRLRCSGILEQWHPDIVVIQAGINDLKFLGIHPELSREIAAGCVANLGAIVGDCQNRHIQVLLTEIWPVGKVSLARRLVWDQAVCETIPVVNEQLRRLATPDGRASVVNLFGSAGLTNAAPQYVWFRDTLHLRHEAYARLSQALKKELEPRLARLAGKGTQD